MNGDLISYPSCGTALHGIVRWYTIPRFCSHRAQSFRPVILVGEAQSWLPELVERAKKLKVNGGFEEGADLCVNHVFSIPRSLIRGLVDL